MAQGKKYMDFEMPSLRKGNASAHLKSWMLQSSSKARKEQDNV